MKRLIFLPLLILSLTLSGQFTKSGGTFLKSGNAFISAPAGPPSTLLTGIVAYYKLDHTSGSTAIDEVGSNDGTEEGEVTENQATAISGRSVLLTGSVTNGAFDMGNTEDLSVGGEGTLSLWIYITDDPTSSANSLVSKINFSTDREGYNIWISGAEEPFSIKGEIASSAAMTQITHGTTISIGQWYHIVMTWSDSNNNISLYLNAGTPTSESMTLTPVTNVSSFKIGVNDDYGNTLPGYYDEVGVWSRVLTNSEITELYNSGSGNTYPF